jgi:hypothetical protein
MKKIIAAFILYKIKDKMKIGIAAVLLCCILLVEASAMDSYLCVSDKSTGFRYNKALDKWEIVNFIVDVNEYIVSRSTDKNIAWEIKRKGESSEFSFCKKDFDEYGFLYCESNIVFRMNKLNQRFININPSGYYNSTLKNNQKVMLYKDGSCKPYIEIGRCSSIIEKPH